ncbi:MAG: hypothetical protein IPH88_16310 [Bacteroidales bacterium]|nr:hypothetical protein [Bacteroidales bacterium]
MGKINDLDLTLCELNKLTSQGSMVTIEDLLQHIEIEKHSLIRILDYLDAHNYCEKTNNAYRITFDGEYFIEKNIFIFRRKPFMLEYIYRNIKFVAYLMNTLLVLALGYLNYGVNKAKVESQSKTQAIVSDSTIKIKAAIYNISTDTLKKAKK